MAYTGIFCTEAEINFKAGENVDATGNTEANRNLVVAEAEAYINCLCRFNFTDVYSSLNADTKYILTEACSNLAAIYCIQYNMGGYASRVDAEDMINILWARFQQCVDLLKDERTIKFINGS